ncbi:MAG: hypothetical protein M3O26_12675 [Pseudomonadota bacterium]|nr:hypothetical protein [Pseudomonadota bacterium]
MSKRKKNRSVAEKQGFVKRHLSGEPVAKLVKEINLSRPGFYSWKNKFRQAIVDDAMLANETSPSVDDMHMNDLKIENGYLKAEKLALQKKIFQVMFENDLL